MSNRLLNCLTYIRVVVPTCFEMNRKTKPWNVQGDSFCELSFAFYVCLFFILLCLRYKKSIPQFYTYMYCTEISMCLLVKVHNFKVIKSYAMNFFMSTFFK
jgi:hypothetical protein